MSGSHDHTHSHDHDHHHHDDERWKHDGVRVIPGNQLDPSVPSTAGMDRKAAINFARVGAQKLWAGTVSIKPDAKTGAHHHGHLESIIYVVKGKARMRWGEKLQFTAEAASRRLHLRAALRAAPGDQRQSRRGSGMRAGAFRRRVGRDQSAAKARQPPSVEYPLGTDFFGRDLYAAMVVGMWQTVLIGVLAGALGTFIGVVLGFTSAYFGGLIDGGIKGVCQVLMPIPVFLIQVVIAGSLDKRSVTIYTMAFIVVLFAWMGPTLVIRSQVLSMKERQFVSVAKLSGLGDGGIIFGEMLPNLLPFIAAAFVGQVFSAVFASFYLAVVGLGPLREPLLGNTRDRVHPPDVAAVLG